jgi:hypothetical protein
MLHESGRLGSHALRGKPARLVVASCHDATFFGGRVNSFVALASSSGVSSPCLASQSSRKEPSAFDRRFAAVTSVSASAGAMLISMGTRLSASVSLRFFIRPYEAVSRSAVLFINRLPQRELCFRPHPYGTTMEPLCPQGRSPLLHRDLIEPVSVRASVSARLIVALPASPRPRLCCW